ncbi:SDR family NAD(P)-dependent oxidoreductase [Mariniflexile gromovii]|uniref:SDR family NAD(P)-dependent oxidoreductase n=1 Tax=Mariniflexile gromovii TaxID=362523 RepID=A0ABS4BWR9_9FLAO|nr:SDR family NAD(P)-dependent oxidoreductase [Mariniflexile gromovii]MBP0905027.1 SDR family NAD(P)-dependent oxidoreductase [Mariniflexile gromovii]
MELEKKAEEKFVLITGASQGLGKAFVNELALRKMNIIMVSLPNENISFLSDEIALKYGVKTYYYETDLTLYNNVVTLTNWLNKNFNIDILINNAGVGGSKKFIEADVNYINSIIQLNVVATSILTHQLLPNLMQHKQSYILNVSSMAAFSPIGYKTVYPASKSFIYSFSRGLSEELKDSNVSVSVVNPGAMKTNNEVKARIEKQGILGKLTLLDPKRVAKLSLQQLFKNNSVIIVNPLSYAILKILPIWIRLPLMTNAIKREI